MEHRWGKRVDYDIGAVIEGAAFGRLQARTKNVSLSGAFLSMSNIGALPAVIFVQLDPWNGSHQRRQRVLAYVVRQTPDGVGLEWAEFAPRMIRSLFDLSLGTIRAMQLVRVSAHDRRLAQT